MPEQFRDNQENMSTTHPKNKPDDVPADSKHPKPRPPTSFREYILRTPLPYYSGPYSVGIMDIEVPVRGPRHFSEIKRQHKHLLELETGGGIVYDLIWEEKELIASFRVAAATVAPQMVQTNDPAHPDSLILATK
ncbi:hypothetical protein B0J14DRAFT_121020 [Halenospora varia]|nr:hypothetical protein B0J14DRAFT_121020 [Halenospora varia]